MEVEEEDISCKSIILFIDFVGGPYYILGVQIHIGLITFLIFSMIVINTCRPM